MSASLAQMALLSKGNLMPGDRDGLTSMPRPSPAVFSFWQQLANSCVALPLV